MEDKRALPLLETTAVVRARIPAATTYEDLWQGYFVDLNAMVVETQQRLRWESSARVPKSPLRDYSGFSTNIHSNSHKNSNPHSHSLSHSRIDVPHHRRRFLDELRSIVSLISQGYFEEYADPTRTDPEAVRWLEERILHGLVPTKAVLDREWRMIWQQNLRSQRHPEAKDSDNDCNEDFNDDFNDDCNDDHEGSQGDCQRRHPHHNPQRLNDGSGDRSYCRALAAVSLAAVTIVGIVVVRSSGLGEWKRFFAFSRTRNASA